MAIVIYASVAEPLCIRDESGRTTADALIARMIAETRVLPGIFWDQMRNILTVSQGRYYGLSAYDAAYLETARRRRAELVAFHQKLMKSKVMDGIAP